jgi:hypothetical protein
MGDAASRLAGIGQLEAAARVCEEGFNEVPAGKRRTLIRILIDVVSGPPLGDDLSVALLARVVTLFLFARLDETGDRTEPRLLAD